MPKSSSPRDLTFEDVQAWLAEFQDESDRAAAVLAVAFLDAQLEEILRAFSADESELGELSRPDRPLGTYDARRRLCLSLGLINPDEAAELRVLGQIRNKFAHQLHGVTFELSPVVDFVQNLKLPQRIFPRYRAFGRTRFTISVAFMHLLLKRRLQVAKAAKRTPAVQTEIPLTPMDPATFQRAMESQRSKGKQQ